MTFLRVFFYLLLVCGGENWLLNTSQVERQLIFPQNIVCSQKNPLLLLEIILEIENAVRFWLGIIFLRKFIYSLSPVCPSILIYLSMWGVVCACFSERMWVDWGTTCRSWLSFHYVDQVIKFGIVPFFKTEPSRRPHFMLFLNSDFYWYLYFFRIVANTFLPCPLLITLWHYYIQFCKEMEIRNCWVWNHFLDSSHSASSVCGMNGEASSHLCVCVALGIGPKPVSQARSCFNTWLHPQPQSCKLMKGMSEMLDFLIFLVRKPILHLIVFLFSKK